MNALKAWGYGYPLTIVAITILSFAVAGGSNDNATLWALWMAVLLFGWWVLIGIYVAGFVFLFMVL
jgi:hypothetical protein